MRWLRKGVNATKRSRIQSKHSRPHNRLNDRNTTISSAQTLPKTLYLPLVELINKTQTTVDKLVEDATAVISDCVNQTMAAESFKWAQKAIDDARNELLEANAELNKEQFKLETEYDPTYDNVCNQCKRAVALVKQLDQISALNDCVTEISKSLLAHLLAAVSSNDKNESEKETLMIRNIIQEVWNGSSLKEFTIACDKYTMLILSESCINNIKHPHSITATGRTIMREQKTHEENALERLDIGLMRTYSQLRPLSSHSSAPYRTRSSDNASTGDENYERWMMQVNLKVRLGLNITTPVQTNLMFRAMDDERHWLMPRPTISEDSATLSRKICFFHPEHKVNESGFEDTPDFIVYHSENKYLRIHLQTMRHCNVKIDLSMFEALDIEHCFIDVDKDQHISLTLITSNKEMYFHHMLCITGVKDLHFSDECIIKSAQIWLLRNQNVVIFPMCRLSAITTWFYQCKEVTNNGTLVNISNCWMDGGDSFENAEEGTVKSYGYLYLNMKQIENNNSIESHIFYHVVANRYKDTSDAATYVADTMYFNIKDQCRAEGMFSASSWLLDVENELILSSNRIMIDRLFYIQCKDAKLINENVTVGLIPRSSINVIDPHKNLVAPRFAHDMTRQATLCIEAESLRIEYGEIEAEIMSLHARTLSISSNKLHVISKLRIAFKDTKEAILSNDGDILIKPHADASAEAYRCMRRSFSADQSRTIIAIQQYEIITRMKGSKLNIMNVTEAQINHCKIECYDISFENARYVRCSDESVINCIYAFACNEMDAFELLKASTLVMNTNKTILNVESSFVADETSSIHCTSQYVEINSTIQTKHRVSIAADDVFIRGQMDCNVLLLTVNTLSISSNKLHIAKQFSVTFKDSDLWHSLRAGEVVLWHSILDIFVY
eukprot:180453_1